MNLEIDATHHRDLSVGVLGAGPIGSWLATRLIDAGRRVLVLAADEHKMASLLASSAQGTETAAAMALSARSIICCIEDGDRAKEAILGVDGIVTVARPGDTLILMSTLDWRLVTSFDNALRAGGIDFVDAPVTGLRTIGAQAGASLTCFAGAADDVYARARPLLELVCSKISHLGPAGHGTAFKIVHSMIAQANRVVAAEALTLGATAGLDLHKMRQLITGSAADSAAIQRLMAHAIERNFSGVALGVTISDVDLQIRLAETLGLPAPMTSQARHIYQMARSMGLGQEDGAAVLKVYEAWAGVEVKSGMPKDALSPDY
jgi:3-hydroxyisobutyrate dehydrogenase-like beta-hydroxyacid dehydrogenase